MRFLVLIFVSLLIQNNTIADEFSFDFSEPNDRRAWTVSAFKSAQGEFDFEELDELEWEADSLNGGGVLSFHDATNWNFLDEYTAPQEVVGVFLTA